LDSPHQTSWKPFSFSNLYGLANETKMLDPNMGSLEVESTPQH